MPSNLQYFSKFPLMYYDIDGSGKNLKLVRDIIHRAQFKKIVLSNTVVLFPYTVKDGETPEIIASKIYDDSRFHWVVLFANEIYNLWTDWPLSYDQFIEFVIKKYGSVPAALATTHHYEDADGNIIDQTSYASLVGYGAHMIDSYAAEEKINSDKAFIKLLDPKYIFSVEQELNNMMIETTS